MSRKPPPESTRPIQVTLAAVLQVRDGRAAGIALAACAASRSRVPGRCRAGSSRRARRSRRRSAGTSPPRSTSARSRTSSRSRPTATPAETRVEWEIATAYLGLVPLGVDPSVPDDTRWHAVDDLPATAFDHGAIVHSARDRLRGKLSYSNIGFALAPATFTLNELRDVYAAALGYDVSATNLKRVLLRRGALVADGRPPRSGPCGRTAGGGVRILRAGTRDHGSVRRPAAAGSSQPELSGRRGLRPDALAPGIEQGLGRDHALDPVTEDLDGDTRPDVCVERSGGTRTRSSARRCSRSRRSSRARRGDRRREPARSRARPHVDRRASGSGGHAPARAPRGARRDRGTSPLSSLHGKTEPRCER